MITHPCCCDTEASSLQLMSRMDRVEKNSTWHLRKNLGMAYHLRHTIPVLVLVILNVASPAGGIKDPVSYSASSPSLRARNGAVLNSAEHRQGMPKESSVVASSPVPRNLLMSFLLLISVVVVGSLSVRDLNGAANRPSRECPLNPLMSKFSNNKSEKDEAALAEAPVDWDKILLSSKYTCVFDPSRLSIDNLLSTPPPTFRSKVDLVSATANYIKLMNKLGNQYKYITIED